MVVEREYRGVISGARADLRRLHEYWMALAFPKARQTHAVMGRWRPEGGLRMAAFRVWSALGVLALVVGYPLLLAGFATRFYSRRLDSTATRLGLVGVVALTAVVWGLLTLLAGLQFSAEGFQAVAAASGVAVASSVLAVVFASLDGRPVTVLLAYPSAMNALFLPPVVAALYSPTLADAVFPQSQTIALWLLDNVFTGPIGAFFEETFDLEGLAYVALWFGFAVPTGWFLGLVVTLADAVRPKADEDGAGR